MNHRPHQKQTDRADFWHDAFIGLLAAFLIVIAAQAIEAMHPSSAHAQIKPNECVTYARVHRQITGSAAAGRAAYTNCIATQCLAVAGSNMGRGVCTAIATVRPAWATDAALHELLRRESSWSTNSVNEGSGACGLFQRLPCPWEYSGGSAGAADDRVYATALQQTTNGVRYIDGRYRTPSRALAHHDKAGWY